MGRGTLWHPPLPRAGEQPRSREVTVTVTGGHGGQSWGQPHQRFCSPGHWKATAAVAVDDELKMRTRDNARCCTGARHAGPLRRGPAEASTGFSSSGFHARPPDWRLAPFAVHDVALDPTGPAGPGNGPRSLSPCTLTVRQGVSACDACLPWGVSAARHAT